MIFDSIQNIGKYRGLSENLDKAIAFVEQKDFAADEPGRYDVCDAFYYTKDTIATRDITDAPFEAHKKYLDIFIPLTGCEIVKSADVSALEEMIGYNEEDDYYIVKGPAQVNCINTPGTFVILFPQDAHNSAGSVDGKTADINKIVVKVRV